MDWHVFIDNSHELLHAIYLTILLTVVALAVSTILGAPMAVLRDRKGVAGSSALVFSWLMRAIPALVLLYLAFYGLPAIGIHVPALAAAIVGLSVQATGYNLEIIRGGLRAVSRQQYDATRALGLPRLKAWLSIILPQALPAIIPPYFTNATNLLKATSIASVITVQEVTGTTTNLIGITYSTVELLVYSAVVYVVLATVMIALQALAERAVSPPKAVKAR